MSLMVSSFDNLASSSFLYILVDFVFLKFLLCKFYPSCISQGQKIMDCKTCCFFTWQRNLSRQSCEYLTLLLVITILCGA